MKSDMGDRLAVSFMMPRTSSLTFVKCFGTIYFGLTIVMDL